MSEHNLDELNMRDILARIDRQRAESDKFAAEQRKLSAEALKLDRDRRLAPATLVVTILGAGAAIFAAGATYIKLTGG